MPFGIVGIVNAASVSSRYSAGDLSGAENASQQAGKWIKWSFWLGLAAVLIYIILVIFLGGFAALMNW